MKWKVFTEIPRGTIIEADEVRIEHGVLIFIDKEQGYGGITTAYKKWRQVSKLEE